MPAAFPRLDVLACAAHPDDVELLAGGTMCLLARQGYRTGVVDFTRGELGTRGTPEGRLDEAAAAAEVLGLAARENLGLPDGHIANTPEHRERLIRVVRRYRPHVLLLNAAVDRHPDHEAAAKLAIDAAFYAGLQKIETAEADGTLQEPWRPHHVLHYMGDREFEPSLVVDVTDVWEQRLAALAAFRSQFHNPAYDAETDEPATFVSNAGFFQWIEARARVYGAKIGATFGEPFLSRTGPLGVSDLMQALGRERAFR
jgi:bacillithiol biosynthesis deacetylase BshB1